MTKVNRCITEGRARFRSVYRGIESGRQCEAFAPLLSALALGHAGPDDVLRLRPHLRHCGACRADVRRLHGSRWPALAALLPLPGLSLPLPGLVDRLRPGSVKAELYGLFSRFGGADPATAALATGGSRGMGATALVSLCLAGAGAGGYCVANGALPDRLTGEKTTQQRSTSASAARPVEATGTPRTVAAALPAAGDASRTTPGHTPAGTGRPDAAAPSPVTARRATDDGNPTSEFEFEGLTTASARPATGAAATGAAAGASPSTSTSSDVEDGRRVQAPGRGQRCHRRLGRVRLRTLTFAARNTR